MEKNILLNIKNLISRLPHSATRVPYTYHHDYLRENTDEFSGMSRSEIADIHDSSDLELYAIALIKILDDLGSRAFLSLSDGDINICKKAIFIAGNKYKFRDNK